VSDRTFRRYINRYEEKGIEGLYDKRLSKASHRRASACAFLPVRCTQTGHADRPVDEVLSLQDLYRENYQGFNVRHFYSWYIKHHQGKRIKAFRADSASYQAEIINYCDRKNIYFAIGGDQDKAVLCIA
jgi:hypothetical protein